MALIVNLHRSIHILNSSDAKNPRGAMANLAGQSIGYNAFDRSVRVERQDNSLKRLDQYYRMYMDYLLAEMSREQRPGSSVQNSS